MAAPVGLSAVGAFKLLDLLVVVEIGAIRMVMLGVVLEHNAGTVGVAAHPDPNAVPTEPWAGWGISSSDFPAVKAASVKKTYIGVGNRIAPTPEPSEPEGRACFTRVQAAGKGIRPSQSACNRLPS
jgi:hypothetical protein